MNKTKLIAVCGVASAVAVASLFFATYAWWATFMLGIVASLSVSIPLILDGKNIVYSIMCYIVSSTIGIFLGVSKLYYVLPIVVFAMPMTMIKCRAESKHDSTENKVLEDPFGDSTVTIKAKEGTPRMKTWVKWLLYYVVLEIALAVTLFATYLFTKPTFETIKNVIWIVVLCAQIVVPPMDFLLTSAIKFARETLRKIVK